VNGRKPSERVPQTHLDSARTILVGVLRRSDAAEVGSFDTAGGTQKFGALVKFAFQLHGMAFDDDEAADLGRRYAKCRS